MNTSNVISLPTNGALAANLRVKMGASGLVLAGVGENAIGTTLPGDLNSDTQAAVLRRDVGIHPATVGNSTALARGDELEAAANGRVVKRVAVVGVAQVETATVVAASGATSNGNVALILTSASVVGSPLTVTVAVTTASNTATLVAAVLAAGLNANAAVADKFLATSSGATVVLTRKADFPGYFVTNDATLNLEIPAGLGITAAATSANTTAGVATSGPAIGVVVDPYPNDTAAAAGDIIDVCYF